MIQTEYYMTRDDGVKLYRTYSDEGFRIIQTDTGVVYDEVVDVEGTSHAYYESTEPIQDELTDSEALQILLGGERYETGTGD